MCIFSSTSSPHVLSYFLKLFSFWSGYWTFNCGILWELDSRTLCIQYFNVAETSSHSIILNYDRKTPKYRALLLYATINNKTINDSVLSWFFWYKETVEVIVHTHTQHISSSIANLTEQLVLYQNKIQWTKHQCALLCVTVGTRLK